MKDNIAFRTIQEAKYIVKNNATVRSTAKIFGVSKSTVHKDCAIRLRHLDRALYEKVKKILDLNLAERHIRGGNATRIKYQQNKK